MYFIRRSRSLIGEWFLLYSVLLCSVVAACQAGQYLDRTGDALVCNMCKYDTYQDEIWQENCKPCPAGMVTFFVGAEMASQCVGKSKKKEKKNTTKTFRCKESGKTGLVLHNCRKKGQHMQLNVLTLSLPQAIIIGFTKQYHWAHCGTFVNGVLLRYMLECLSIVANFITAYEESQ